MSSMGGWVRLLPSFFPKHLLLQYSIEADYFGPLERKVRGAAKENMVWDWYKGEGPSDGPWDSTKEYSASPKGVPDPPQWPKWPKWLISFFLKSFKIPACNQIFGPSGPSEQQRRGQDQRCHGVAHERQQNAQNLAAVCAPPKILKIKGK